MAFYIVVILVLIFSIGFVICKLKLQSVVFGVAIRAQKGGSLSRISVASSWIESMISHKAIGYFRVLLLMWEIKFLKQS